MKKTSIFTMLMVLLGFMTNAQTISTNPGQVFDGMDSIIVHYNPYGTGGAYWDTVFQTFSGPLYAYCYTTDSTSAGGGAVGTYNNGSWSGVVTGVDSFVKVSDSDWVWVMPNVRQFFGVPKDVYISGINIIVKAAGAASGDSQAANGYIPVSEAFSAVAGQVLTTGPLTNPPTTLLADGTENLVVYYHPQNDTSHYGTDLTHDGDVIFKTITDPLYVYAYVLEGTPAAVGTTKELVGWGSVGTTPLMQMVEIDSNDYAWGLPDLRDYFIASGLPSGTAIDTLALIPRVASGDTQTINLYIPLVISTTSVANVNNNNLKVSLYPNPATTGIMLSYAFGQQAATTVTISNVLGQTVMTQNLGQKQAGNVYLSVENIPAGAYLVTVTNGSNKSVQHLVKQ